MFQKKKKKVGFPAIGTFLPRLKSGVTEGALFLSLCWVVNAHFFALGLSLLGSLITGLEVPLGGPSMVRREGGLVSSSQGSTWAAHRHPFLRQIRFFVCFLFFCCCCFLFLLLLLPFFLVPNIPSEIKESGYCSQGTVASSPSLRGEGWGEESHPHRGASGTGRATFWGNGESAADKPTYQAPPTNWVCLKSGILTTNLPS